MITTEQLMADLAARNPILDADIRSTTGGRRRFLAQAWTGAAGTAAPDDVLAGAPISPTPPQRGRLLLVAAAVATLMAGTAAVVSGVAGQPIVRVAGPAQPDLDPLADADLTGISGAQATTLEDRVVTKEEYDAAYQRHQQCLSAAGFEIREVPLISAEGTHIYSTPNEAVESGADEECYDREYRWTDMLWQGRPDVQDHPARTQWMRDCLQVEGIEPQDTAAELNQQLQEAGLEPPDCLD